MKDDLRTLLKQNGGGGTFAHENSLKVLIVDDEPTVHDITALVLKNFRYRGYRLELISAYSATEAREVLATRGPFALVLLDVIMETDDAGLGLAKYIREELKDPMVRIVLRTGQPGMVPQRQVMRDYEIDDYKEKAELTSERFDAAVTASIRTYLGFYRLEQSRQGLLRILNAIQDLEIRELDEGMGHRILDHMEGVMNRSENGGSGSIFVTREKERDLIVSGRGSLENLQDRYVDDLDDLKLAAIVRNAINNVNMDQDDRRIMATMLTRDGGKYLAYFEDIREFGDVDRYLLQLYASHVSLSLNNKILKEELLDTQKEIITTLGEVIESRSGETGIHVQRVGELARLMALHSGFSEQKRDLLMFAAPLHDIGKVGIPDSILKNPGKLTHDEFEVMKKHSEIGYNILKGSNKDVLKLGARICLEHHEWWNGKGYPAGLSGEKISLESRICAIADVLDALKSKRVYKNAVSLDEAMNIIRLGRGTQFDADLVDILMNHDDEVKRIYDNPDR